MAVENFWYLLVSIRRILSHQSFFCSCEDRYRQRPGRWRLLGIGVAYGLSLLTKFTAVMLLPVLYILLVAIAFTAKPGQTRPFREAARELLLATRRFAAVCGVAILVVNLGYGFQGTLQRMDAYEWQSASGTTARRLLPPDLPVPLPSDFVEGFGIGHPSTLAKYRDEQVIELRPRGQFPPRAVRQFEHRAAVG